MHVLQDLLHKPLKRSFDRREGHDQGFLSLGACHWRQGSFQGVNSERQEAVGSGSRSKTRKANKGVQRAIWQDTHYRLDHSRHWPSIEPEEFSTRTKTNSAADGSETAEIWRIGVEWFMSRTGVLKRPGAFRSEMFGVPSSNPAPTLGGAGKTRRFYDCNGRLAKVAKGQALPIARQPRHAEVGRGLGTDRVSPTNCCCSPLPCKLSQSSSLE